MEVSNKKCSIIFKGDSMKINKIKKQNNKYKIILEDNKEIITYDQIIIKNNILYKKQLTEEQIKTIEEENKYYEIYNNILKFIKTKLRSEYEIEEYLKKQGINQKTKEKLIKTLKEEKLINDEIYIKAYIHDKISLTNDGPNKIKKDLINKKIPEDLINNELEKLDNEEIKEKLEKLIIKKLKSNTKYSQNMMNIKLLNYFLNLGYAKEEILNIIEQNKTTNNNIIKKEYNKLYNKLKNKYQEEELKRNIKQKLYQKGFNTDEINNIVN